MTFRPLALALLTFTAATAAYPLDLTRQRVEADIRFLASDLLEGRGTPGRSIELAALYLSTQLQKAGWQPPSDAGYLQRYTIMSYLPSESRYEITLAGERLRDDEYAIVPTGLDPTRGTLRSELTFVGRGVDYPEKNVRDYAGRNVRGKAVVALHGAPWPVDPQIPFGPDHILGKMIAAATRNATVFVYAMQEMGQSGEAPSADAAVAQSVAGEQAFLPQFEGRPTSGLGAIVMITERAFDRTLAKRSGHSYAEWQSLLDRQQAPIRDLGATIELKIEAKPRQSTAPNVVAILPGSDPELRNQWVVLTAHFDHLGSVPAEKGRDTIYNGADDNASGTAAVLEIARRLAEGPRPKRSVMVLLVSGEERGLLGSAHYSSKPLVPMRDVAVNINVDMVGRSDGRVQGITHTSQKLFDMAAAIGREQQITVLPDQQPSWRVAYLTDSYHFARFGVPSIEFFTGLHTDYHEVSDDPDKIHYEELSRIVNVMHELARRFADGAPRLATTRPEWFLVPE